MRGYIENMPYVTWRGKRNKRAGMQKKALLILACLMITLATFSGSVHSSRDAEFTSKRIDIGFQG